MKTEVGLWIDHRHAVVVTLNGQEATVQHIESEFEKRVRFSGASETHDPNSNDDNAEDRRDRKLDDQLTRFYTDVTTHLHDAEAVYIMGPAEAKIELQKHLEKHKLTAKILAVEPAEKLSDAQITAKVRQYFSQHQTAH
ncbi:MAG: hypothetical protein LCI00_27540 [Chloroflexi bacterium]|nr:hypothetical protein [Chloroflexota bacterium]MCC6897245.1 hypothetical protein [Anaerolineae bacterium]